MSDIQFLEQLEALIRQRLEDAPQESYTAKLAARGVAAVAQKVGEEAVELALAAVTEADRNVIDESADLIYHMLVLLAVRNISLADAVATLEQRHDAREAK
ncbi:MAG TPA: phosphoribosyl-ATP diphosphatase [Gammaproteobacteria bacterium]|jgi:phosphoribosyl-ATP pyrophosphohydrolase/phosphoribosyl-AMP cyclohydrolase